MKLAIHRLSACLALLPTLGFAQSSVFNTTFDAAHNALNSSTFNITAQGSTWNVASSTDARSSSLNAGGLTLTIPSSTPGIVEAQTRFTTSPITLSANGDYVKVVTTFSGTNVLPTGAGSTSQLNIGLFDSAANNPLAGLNNAGLSTLPIGENTSGGAQPWEGYVAKIVGGTSGAVSGVYQRAVQNITALTSNNQDLLFSGATGGYRNPNAAPIGSSNAAGVWAPLSSATPYTLAFTITRATADSYTIGYELFSGSGTGGTTLASYSATTTTTNYLSNLTFDGLAIGARYSGAAASDITYSSLSVSTNTVSAVPEPSTYAALAGLAALGLVAWRRLGART